MEQAKKMNAIMQRVSKKMDIAIFKNVRSQLYENRYKYDRHDMGEALVKPQKAWHYKNR